MPIRLPETISQSQTDWNKTFGIYLHRRRYEILRGLTPRQLFDVALDVGCGEGLLRAMGSGEAVGIDLSSGKGVTIFASAEYLPFRPECFDLVFAGEVIEHLENPAKALGEWVGVLKPQGKMILSTPNGVLVPPTNPEHKRTYAPHDLQARLRSLGLRVIAKKGIFTGLVSGRRLFRWIPSENVRMLLLRLPVPLFLSYDVFIILVATISMSNRGFLSRISTA